MPFRRASDDTLPHPEAFCVADVDSTSHSNAAFSRTGSTVQGSRDKAVRETNDQGAGNPEVHDAEEASFLRIPGGALRTVLRKTETRRRVSTPALGSELSQNRAFPSADLVTQVTPLGTDRQALRSYQGHRPLYKRPQVAQSDPFIGINEHGSM